MMTMMEIWEGGGGGEQGEGEIPESGRQGTSKPDGERLEYFRTGGAEVATAAVQTSAALGALWPTVGACTSTKLYYESRDVSNVL